MVDRSLACYRCGHALRLMPRERVERNARCSSCGTDLHSCVHCRFFDPGRNNQCSEPQAEWVREKESSNFCGYFEPRSSVNLTARGRRNPAADAREAFHNLFKK